DDAYFWKHRNIKKLGIPKSRDKKTSRRERQEKAFVVSEEMKSNWKGRGSRRKKSPASSNRPSYKTARLVEKKQQVIGDEKPISIFSPRYFAAVFCSSRMGLLRCRMEGGNENCRGTCPPV
ncbi:hypothetical protein AVEN_114922-1, partial [Araneus ventricosus]